MKMKTQKISCHLTLSTKIMVHWFYKVQDALARDNLVKTQQGHLLFHQVQLGQRSLDSVPPHLKVLLPISHLFLRKTVIIVLLAVEMKSINKIQEYIHSFLY